MPQANNSEHFTKEQKVGFSLLLVFALLIVGVGFLQVRNTLYDPFAAKPKEKKEVSLLNQDEQVRLQAIDTDHDGINDYQELNFYSTSPYLPDTDSDGMKDKDELDKGRDPLCPEGKDCSQLIDNPVTSSTNGIMASPLLGDVQSPTQILQDANSQFQEQQAQKTDTEINPQNMDLSSIAKNPDQIREMLLQTGKITEEQLKKLDDSTLLLLAQQIIAQQQGSTSSSNR